MKKLVLVVGAVFALVASACSSGGSSNNGSTGASGSSGKVDLVMWMGYTPPPPQNQSYEYNSLNALVQKYEADNPNVHITLQYVNSDNALTKLTVALQGNEQPDITYQYGTNMAQVGTTPKVVDLTSRVNGDASFNWNDFFPGERAAATVDGKILGVPALVDNLAVVYNKDLFQKAGLPEPPADWTWDDLIRDATALADPAAKQFGLEFPADGSETTMWKVEPILWEAGGSILNADNTKAEFNSAAGVKALDVLDRLRSVDGALYLNFHPDADTAENLFNGNRIGMFITGPWDLQSFPDVNYGVQIMPSFPGSTDHQTIAGPDNWVIMDNGSARVNAAWDFVKWLTSPDQVLADSLATGHLPTRSSVEQLPAFSKFLQEYPNLKVFIDNLQNVQQARPVIAAYPQVSAAYGQAVVKVLLGQSDPQTALNAAAQEADGILAVPA